jgi:hypothetical protein
VGSRQAISVIVALLLGAFAAQCILSMARKSATSDEVPHLAAGYAYLARGDYRLNPEHPPLVKLVAAVPLMFLNLEFNESHPGWIHADEWWFGEEFVNDNRVPAPRMVFMGRLPVVALGLILGLLIYIWASRIYGTRGGLIALLLYAFSPNMLANSRLVTMDLAVALFTLLSVYTFYRLLKRPGTGTAALAGIAFGLALATKFTAFSLIPVYVILGTIFLARERPERVEVSRIVSRALVMLAMAAAVVILTYRVVSFGSYFEGLRFFMDDVGAGGRPSFLFGRYSTHGWAYYFLAAMLIKTPIPTLALIGASVVLLIVRRHVRFEEYCLIVPIIVFMTISSFSRLQLGLRYVLHVYPFLFILAGGVAALAIRKHLPALIATAALLVWYVAGTLLVFPDYIPYFNEFVGGPGRGYLYLIDSNVDWGQDLPGLRKYLDREGNPEVILSFFGTASPRGYGIEYQDFYSFNRARRTEEHLNSVSPRREVFVISANALECLYFPDKDTFDWLKRKEPAEVIGHSLFVYDITHDVETQLRLGIMYLAGRLWTKAERQMRRVLVLDPDNREAMHYLEVAVGRGG